MSGASPDGGVASAGDPHDDIHFDLKKLLTRPSAFQPGSLVHPQVRAGHPFDPATALQAVQNARVAVIGAGGLGCELLKNLALSGFRRVSVIDADEIDVTNLNRQFLFRRKDVGRGKAEAAAEFVARRIPGLELKTYNCFVQKVEAEHEDFDFADFDVVISGLDNLAARTWVGDRLMQLVQYGPDGTPDPSTVIPLIDGGTEGYDGQVHVVMPFYTQDFAGRSWMFPKRRTVAICTLASSPRKPEHCVLWVMEGAEKGCWNHMARAKVEAGEWAAVRKFNTDNPEDMKWITEHVRMLLML
jgi:ubiquitin-activating enzyme E1 C